MKIPEQNPSVLLESALLGKQSGVHASKGSDVSQKHEVTAPASTDQVDISEQAQTFQKINKLAATGTDVRASRIDKIRNEIEAGTYQPDAKQIAEKLVRSTLLENIL